MKMSPTWEERTGGCEQPGEKRLFCTSSGGLAYYGHMAEPTGIVVVSEEELFIAFTQRFSPQTHLVHYAASPSAASGYCAHSPGLMVVTVDQPSTELDQLLGNCTLHDVRVLGLYRQADPPARPVDLLAPAHDRELVYQAAAIQTGMDHPSPSEWPESGSAGPQARLVSDHSRNRRPLIVETRSREAPPGASARLQAPKARARCRGPVILTGSHNNATRAELRRPHESQRIRCHGGRQAPHAV